MSNYKLVFDGVNCGRFPTLGNLLTTSKIKVSHEAVKFTVPSGTADMTISGQAGGTNGNNNQELQLSVENGLVFIKVGNASTTMGLVNEVFSLGDGGYPYMASLDSLSYTIDLVAGTADISVNGVVVSSKSISIGAARDDGQYFYIGGRNKSDSWSFDVQYQLPEGSHIGNTQVEIDDVLVLDAVSDGAGDTWETTTANDGTIVNGGAVWSVYASVSDVNGGTVELGQSFIVQMSNAITVDDLYFKAQDGAGNEYHPVFSVNGDTITASVPLTSDDTIPMFGTMTMHIVSGADTFTKDFEFTSPVGDTVVLLENPIESNKSSYSYDKAWTPVEGDKYFHNPTTDFSITVNNVLQPSGEAPWEHTVWHLSGAGLRETTAQSGYAVQNQSPTANAGVDLTEIDPGASIPLDGSGSTDDDGTIVSYLWEQVGASNAPIADVSAATTTATAPRASNASTLTFRLTVTDDLGATATDTKTVGVLADQKPTFVGDTNPITVEYGSVFTPPSLTVVDAEDGDLGAATVTGTVDTSTLGAYPLTVTGPQDSNGVAPDPITITVTVVESKQPEESTVTFTLTNMPNSQYMTTIFIPDNEEIVYHGMKQWSGGSASFNLSGVSPGASCEVWVRSTNGTGRGMQEGVSA